MVETSTSSTSVAHAAGSAAETDRERLARFFRDERPDLGFEGDVEGWSPVESAMAFLRRERPSPNPVATGEVERRKIDGDSEEAYREAKAFRALLCEQADEFMANGNTAAMLALHDLVGALRNEDACQFRAALTPSPARDEMREATIDSVYAQARDNHARYSATGDRETDIRFFALGLAGEAGEVANFVKKRWRDGDGHDDDLRKECADVFAYTIMLADALGMTPQDLIDMVAHKQAVFVAKMQARATLSGVQSPTGYTEHADNHARPGAQPPVTRSYINEAHDAEG